MMEIDQGESDNEEVLVYVDFDSKLDELFVKEPNFKLIALDTQTPFCQLGNQVFKGEWKNSMGTFTFFEEDPSPDRSDPVFSDPPEHMLKYICKTDKILHMSRVFVESKDKHKTVPPEDPLGEAGPSGSAEKT